MQNEGPFCNKSQHLGCHGCFLRTHVRFLIWNDFDRNLLGKKFHQLITRLQ